jgi:hypothetical protein
MYVLTISWKVCIVPGIVGWITQLVVDKRVCKHYMMTQFLQTLKAHLLFQNVTVVGLVTEVSSSCVQCFGKICIMVFI